MQCTETSLLAMSYFRNVRGAEAWGDFFKLILSFDVPEDFMADRPMNLPPMERKLFEDA